MAEQPTQQQQEGEKTEPARLYAEISPLDVPTLAPMPLSEEEEEEEVMREGPELRPGRWVIADTRSGELETEPARNNLARTYTLLTVAERLQQLVTEELEKIRKMKEDVVSGSRLKAVAKMRVWYMEHSFHRLLRSHVEEFRRELSNMREVLGHFDASTIERDTGGPTLCIMQELSSSGSASTSAPAAPPAASASGLHALEAGESGDGKTTYSVEVEAGAIALTRVCARASTEEVAAGGASSEVVAAGRAGLSEQATRQWRPGRIEKKADGASSSSSGNSNDSLTASASALQEPGPTTQEAVVVDTLLASVQESEASAASDAMSMLQWTFTKMSNLISQHIAVADSILRHNQQRSLVVPGDDRVQEQEESPPTPQRQLLLDLELMLDQINKAQGDLSWSVATLHHILGELPPIPSAVRLPPTPPTPPSPDAGGNLARFSQIFKKPFSRSK